MRNSLVFMLLLAIVLLSGRFEAQIEHVLDLLNVPSVAGALVPNEEGHVPLDQRLGPGTVALSSHRANPESPFTLKVTLLAFDRVSYATRDPLFYEVRLVNTGSKPLLFPWSVDNSLLSASLPDSYVVLLGLGDATDVRAAGQTGLVVLYGAPRVPGSLETVLPGESIRIRVKSDWMMNAQESKRMRVYVRPSYAGRAYPPVTSENAIIIQSRGPRQ